MEIGTKPTKMIWRQKLFSVIIIGAFYALALYVVEYFLFKGKQPIESIIFQGIGFGLIFGLSFPFIMYKLGSKFSSKSSLQIIPNLENNEKVEIEGPANLFRGIEGVGGKIFLTNKNLIFKAHKINIQTGQTNIEYDSIKEILKRKTGGLFQNGIRIVTDNNSKFDFVVNKRDLWIEKINERISN